MVMLNNKALTGLLAGAVGSLPLTPRTSQNHLGRSLEFKVGPDGQFVSATASANKLGHHRAIFPVQISSDQDGKGNKTAFEADAYYGNSLTGFTAAP